MHTPGPWEAKRLDSHHSHIQSENGLIARTALGIDQPPEALHANARLIAAAPDMLEALEEARIALKHCVECMELNSLPESAFRTVRAAIAKATGAVA